MALRQKNKSSPCSRIKFAMKENFRHIKALTWKNYLIFRNQLFSTSVQLLSPVFICIHLLTIQAIITGYIKLDEVVDHPVKAASHVPKCLDQNCVSLGVGFTHGKTDWTDFLLNQIAEESNLELGKDIRVYSENNYKEFFTQLNNHTQKTQIGVVFCTKELELPQNPYLESLPCEAQGVQGQVYSIVYNFTKSPFVSDRNAPDPLDKTVIALKVAVDNALLAYHSHRKGIEKPVIEVEVQRFPTVSNRIIEGVDVVSSSGPLYFFIPPMFIFSMLVSEIVKEKENKLRHGLSVMGVSATSFWISWFLIGFFLNLFSTNLLILCGYISNFDFFLNTPYLVLLLTFLLFGVTMIIFGFFVSTLIGSARLAYTLSYAFLLGGLVLQIFLQNHLLMMLLHVETLPNWAKMLLDFCKYYPPFNFSKMFNDIAVKSSSHPSHSERMWVKGTEYTWTDFFSYREGHVEGMFYRIPPTYVSVFNLLVDILIFAVLTWFFDHVIPANRGKHSPLWFPFTKEYWGFKPSSRTNSEIELVDIASQEESSQVSHESPEAEPGEGLRLEQICKTFKKYSFCKLEREIQAVKPLELSVHKDQVLVLIGHNGAGKTTLMSMLTGLLTPTSGTAYISNYDINTEQDSISRIIGYCPQFNILWEELTGKQHLHLFTSIKNISKELEKSLVEEKLSEVGLLGAADSMVCTYSGGMKRRLSVAISGIGNPAVIFMDEPTTGMDPISRRFVWKLVQKMKKDKVIVLSTHSMEEAEVLGDKIVVMVDGKFRCVGTSLYLKNHFGEGYKIEFISQNCEKLWSELSKLIPSAHLVDSSGGNLLVSVPRTEVEDLRRFFKEVENKTSKINKWIEDWGLSNSSLEEVFMRVTGKLHSSIRISD